MSTPTQEELDDYDAGLKSAEVGEPLRHDYSPAFTRGWLSHSATETQTFRSSSTQGEKCWCRLPAAHKVEETIFHDDPNPVRHPRTSYICEGHFQELMGPSR